jgi:hypothetical protein
MVSGNENIISDAFSGKMKSEVSDAKPCTKGREFI